MGEGSIISLRPGDQYTLRCIFLPTAPWRRGGGGGKGGRGKILRAEGREGMSLKGEGKGKIEKEKDVFKERHYHDCFSWGFRRRYHFVVL